MERINNPIISTNPDKLIHNDRAYRLYWILQSKIVVILEDEILTWNGSATFQSWSIDSLEEIEIWNNHNLEGYTTDAIISRMKKEYLSLCSHA